MNSINPHPATIVAIFSMNTAKTRNRAAPGADGSIFWRSSRLAYAGLLILAMVSINSEKVNADDSPLQAVVDAYAKDLINGGHAVGVGVGVVRGGQVIGLFSYGAANVAKNRPFTVDSLFEIGSVTKVFTTNLLGQKAAKEDLPLLQQQLGTFQAQFPGILNEKTSQISLLELGDFTAGLPDLPPLCPTDKRHKPIKANGCLPILRPPIAQYSARYFLSFLKSTAPKDYNKPGHPNASLPAPYFYSDYTTGLLGLLLATRSNQPITNKSLDQWWTLVKQDLVAPLGMPRTYLRVPRGKVGLVAQGYNLAEAGKVSVTNGSITGIELLAEGAGYPNPPTVQIAGGNGSGATAVAEPNGAGGVKGITVTQSGKGYIAPPNIQINGGGGLGATARAIISQGSLVGVEVTNSGQCYSTTASELLTVVIEGGRRPNSDPSGQAEAVAEIANGQVRYIRVTRPGSDYVEPITVSLSPGRGITNKIPIWAAAGSIKSTIRDMTHLLLAALGEDQAGGRVIDPLITQGFRIAETPYTNNGQGSGSCPNNQQTGLAWMVSPSDTVSGYPQIISKNGGLDGFSTQVILIPSDNPDQRIGVVVFVNSRSGKKGNNLSFEPAGVLAENIIGWLLHQSSNP